MQESEAIHRLQAGDIGGLEYLVQLYQAQALKIAVLICHDYPLAEDIVQTAFLRAYERIHQFDASRPFGPWFPRSVLNDALKATTTRGRHVALELQEHSAAEPMESEADPLTRFEALETKEEIRQALRQLSPRLRAVVVAHYYLERTDAEIARDLLIPRGTVRRRLHDARQRLRLLLPGRVKLSE